MKYKKLNNGVNIPILGYSTYQISPSNTEQCVLNALEVGYRLIDTAAAYKNEKEIGNAIKKSKIPREQIFITTKVWVQDTGYANTLKAFDNSLKNLDVEYIDMYLIHQPYGDYYGSYRAMEELYHKGKVRAIGVCNFSLERFVDLYMNSKVKPMINQLEYHPFFQQTKVQKILEKHGCLLEAWGPLNEGQRDIFQHSELKKIAEKHKKTIAQIVLRWHVEKGVIAIPKTVSKERMIENMDIWNFELDMQDHKIISTLDLGYSEIINHLCYSTAKCLNKCKIHN